jgi:hypothetical protein
MFISMRQKKIDLLYNFLLINSKYLFKSLKIVGRMKKIKQYCRNIKLKLFLYQKNLFLKIHQTYK